MSWSTGLCSCCAAPGGCGLCCRTCFCPCTVAGDINARAGGPGDFWGGCLAFMFHFGPCCMAMDAPTIAEKAGFEESPVKAFCCTCMPCTACCYLMQVHRETEIKSIRPGQEEMK